MILTYTWIRSFIFVAITSLASCSMLTTFPANTESSAEYLKKVMLELRDMNLPPSFFAPEHSTGSFYFDVDDRHYLASKRHSGDKRQIQQYLSNENGLALRTSPLETVAKKIRPAHLDAIVSDQVHAPRTSSQQNLAEIPEMSNLKLNTAIYKHPIGKGNVGSLNALVDVLRHRQLQKIMTNQLETRSPNPMYSYYFYPLKTVMNDIRHGNNLFPAMHLRPETAASMENSQKDMDDKFLHLTKTVGEAIDHHNCSAIDSSYTNLDERIRVWCPPVKIPRPSSVVLLTKKSALQKEAKRRKKIFKKCKSVVCKKIMNKML
ncbi:uncharacterized protein [Venturia canescens]|uniref:uncharacterized protein isoform X2 n=1 Tax=Venturia canescens TaxID=32260 RepID=UPI001C9CA4DA|nr:uncharacterized protein LOC122406619 isoform X2 [Venturia canescens]